MKFAFCIQDPFRARIFVDRDLPASGIFTSFDDLSGAPPMIQELFENPLLDRVFISASHPRRINLVLSEVEFTKENTSKIYEMLLDAIAYCLDGDVPWQRVEVTELCPEYYTLDTADIDVE